MVTGNSLDAGKLPGHGGYKGREIEFSKYLRRNYATVVFSNLRVLQIFQGKFKTTFAGEISGEFHLRAVNNNVIFNIKDERQKFVGHNILGNKRDTP